MTAVPMVVPRPAGCDDEVARVHLSSLTIDRCVGTAAFHHKTQRALSVPMAWGHFTRQDDLQTSVERLRDAGLAFEGWVFKYQNPAHSFFSCYQLARLHKVRSNVTVPPVSWHARSVGGSWHQGVQNLPQRAHAALAYCFIKGLAFSCVVGLDHV